MINHDIHEGTVQGENIFVHINSLDFWRCFKHSIILDKWVVICLDNILTSASGRRFLKIYISTWQEIFFKYLSTSYHYYVTWHWTIKYEVITWLKSVCMGQIFLYTLFIHNHDCILLQVKRKLHLLVFDS